MPCSRLARPLPRRAVLAGLLALAGTPATAQQAGDWRVQVGAVDIRIAQARTRRVHTELTQDSLASLLVPRAFDNAVEIRPQDARTLGLSLAYFLRPTLALELDLGVPPRVEAHGQGVAAPPGPAGFALNLDLGDPAINPLGSQRQWSPVLALRYQFRPGQALAPFVLAGASYTWFTHTRLNPAFAERLDARFGQFLATAAGKPGPTRARADTPAGWTPVGGAGLAWQLDRRWQLVAALGYAPFRVEPTLEMRAADGTLLARSRAELEIDALVASLGIGYAFRLGDAP